MHILVHLDGSPASERTLHTAAHFASRHGALLRGMFLSQSHSSHPEDTGPLQDKFLEKACSLCVGAEWLGRAESLAHLVSQGFASDLLITGQPTGSAGLEFVERLILRAGRPIMLVPTAGRYESCGTRIMVAWSSGREAARAVTDAIPILQGANRVWLTTTTPESGVENSIAQQLNDLVSFLKHHRIGAIPDTLPCAHLHPGDVLLSRACEEGIDLLVMGAINVTSGSRPVLGKVAAHILQHMTLPVLLSH
jgi:nucleotide-binding universal stress UspA family protein